MNSIFPIASESKTRQLGERGEQLAAEFLARRGFRLVAANFVVPIGRNRRNALVNAEIDLIAYDGATLVFIEVKTRSSADFAAPETAVDLRKQRQIIRAAKVYRKIFHITDRNFRFDVIAIVLPENIAKPQIEHFKGFWTERKFRKKSWRGDFFGD